MHSVNYSGFIQFLKSLALKISLGAVFLHAGNPAIAAENETKVIEVNLGSYEFMPHDIQLVKDQPVVLRFTNHDAIIPHNFTIEDIHGGLDINVDVPAGKTVDVQLKPSVLGQYTFYCNKKLLFMRSHRERGMVGALHVVPEAQ